MSNGLFLNASYRLLQFSDPHVLQTSLLFHALFNIVVLILWLGIVFATSTKQFDWQCMTLVMSFFFESSKFSACYLGWHHLGTERSTCTCCLSLYVASVTAGFYLFLAHVHESQWQQCKSTAMGSQFLACASLVAVVFSASVAVARTFSNTLARKIVLDNAAVDPAADVLGSSPCVICLCDFEEEHLVRRFSCGHSFHKHCADSWLSVSVSCPFRCHL